MKTTRNVWILLAVSMLAIYVAGYFLVVHKRLQNPFISWPIMRPLPMDAYYSPSSFKVIYEPIVRLDQKLFPARWMCPPTPKDEYEILLKGIDLNRVHKMSKSPNTALEATPHSHCGFASEFSDLRMLRVRGASAFVR
jgi:hypothetical protein